MSLYVLWINYHTFFYKSFYFHLTNESFFSLQLLTKLKVPGYLVYTKKKDDS